MNLYIDPGNVPSFPSKILCSIFSCPKADYWEGTLHIEPECPRSLQKRCKTCTASSFLVYRVESKIRWEMSSTERTVVFYKDLRNTLAKPFSWMLELGLCPELLQPGEGGTCTSHCAVSRQWSKGEWGCFHLTGYIVYCLVSRTLSDPSMLTCDCAICFLCISGHVQSTSDFGYLSCRGLRAMINKWLQSALRSLGGRSCRNANYYYFLGQGKKAITCRPLIFFFYFILANECE